MTALLERWTGLVWRSPEALWLLLLLPLVLRLGRTRATLTFAPAFLLSDGRGDALPASRRARWRGLPGLLGALGLVGLVLALARPAERAEIVLEREGVDLLLALDVSSSMSATDLDPRRSRLDVAKAAAREFVARRPDDRIGLLAFARYADLVTPPTLDHAALDRALDGLIPVAPDAAEDATALGLAAARGVELLARSDAASKVLILWTDGEETVATTGAPTELSPATAALLAAKRGVRVHVVVPTALGDGARPLETTAASVLASATGGLLARAGNARDARDVFARLDALERTRFREPRVELLDAFLPILVAALACLVAARLLDLGPLGTAP